MHDVNLDAALRESVAQALEEMFFVYDIDEAEPGARASGPELIARVDFKGEPSGSLTLRAGLDSARSLAADFLGEEEHAVSAGQTADVFTELANIVCGAVLTRTESYCSFHLSPPRILSSPEGDLQPEHDVEYAVSLPNGPLAAFLKTEAR
jgi:CheY-specific phosphatase CheX